MVKEFFMFGLFVLLMAVGIVSHYMTYNATEQASEISRIVSLTKLASPSLSVAFYEPRIFLLEHAANPAYPQMQPINKMDFVYAKQ